MNQTSLKQKATGVGKVMRVEVCGGIASGKTNFASLFRPTKITPVLEDFRANPFWKSFYLDPERYSFEAELTFLLQHYHDIKRETPNAKFLVCDFAIVQDLAYTLVTIHGRQRKAYETIHRQIRRELSPPQIIVHLKCDPETELRRIRKRHRREELTLDLKFLSELNDAIDVQVAKAAGRCKLLSIDSAKEDFVHDELTKRRLRAAVIKALASKKSL